MFVQSFYNQYFDVELKDRKFNIDLNILQDWEYLSIGNSMEIYILKVLISEALSNQLHSYETFLGFSYSIRQLVTRNDRKSLK